MEIYDDKYGLSIVHIEDLRSSRVEAMYIDDFMGYSGLYVNRLIVDDSMRNRGIATRLMEKLVMIIDKKGIDVILEINPYGDLDFEQLERFYGKFGFIRDENGVYVRKAV